jgi:cysteine desulfurase
VSWLPVPECGRIDPDDVRRCVSKLAPGFVVALMAVNHETGVVQPVASVADLVHERGGRLHVDAVQAIGKLPRSAWAGADSIAFAAHKIRGPKGIGALAWTGPPPAPVLLGGAQERGIRPGTLDPLAAAGLSAAVAHAERMPERYAALGPLRDRLEAELARFGVVNGADADRVPHVSNVSVSRARGDELVAALDLEGVQASSGSACSAGTSEPSPVIAAMGGLERAASAIRWSLGETTTSSDVDEAIQAWLRVVARLPSRP